MTTFTELETPADIAQFTGGDTLPAADVTDVYKRALDGDPEALAQIAKWKKTSPKAAARLAHRYAEALAKLERAEADIVRTFNRWAKHRALVRRYSQQLDKLDKSEEA